MSSAGCPSIRVWSRNRRWAVNVDGTSKSYLSLLFLFSPLSYFINPGPHISVKAVWCVHLIKLCTGLGKDIRYFVRKRCTTDRWRRQYPKHIQFEVPDLTTVKSNLSAEEHLGIFTFQIDGVMTKGSLGLPPITPNPRGRPRKQGREKSAIERAVTANPLGA